MQTHLLRISFNAQVVVRGGVTQARVNQGCAPGTYTPHLQRCGCVYIYLSLSHIQVFSYLWHAGWGADSLSSHHGGVWDATQILSIASLELLASPGEPAVNQRCAPLRAAGLHCGVSGCSWSGQCLDNHIPPSAPGTARCSAPPALHLQGPALADETFQSHLELHWLFFFFFFCIMIP